MICQIFIQNCTKFLDNYKGNSFDLTFLDPPFNQDKEYRNHNDSMEPKEYWHWMRSICVQIYNKSSEGAAIYFMQREKNSKFVFDVLDSSGWTFQNLIIWKKKTSAIPSNIRYGKHYQIIAFFTKGNRPRIFNKLRIDPPLLETEKYRRPNGIFLTDVWDDIRELTSGYLAGNEPLRDEQGERIHKQQSPVHLLMRIILSSTSVGDLVFDPFAGTGTTLVVSKQLVRNSIGIEIDPINAKHVMNRIKKIRSSDDISIHRNYYRFTQNLNKYWPSKHTAQKIKAPHDQLDLFDSHSD